MKINISTIRPQLSETGRKYPLEIIAILFFSALWFMQAAGSLPAVFSMEFLISYPFCLAVIYSMNILSAKTGNKIPYFLSILSLPLFWFLRGETHEYLILSFCSILLMMIVNGNKDNDKFVVSNYRMLGNIVAAGLLTGILFGVVMIITASVDAIFGIYVNYQKVSSYAADTSFLLLAPLMFLLMENRRDFIIPLPSGWFVNVLVNYILSPALLVYTLILYVYFVKIIVQWSLPEGVVSTVSICFIISCILINSIQFLLKRRYYNWFYRNLTLWCAPAVIMLWVGTIYRINEYGFTVDRVYLLWAACILAASVVSLLFKKLGRYKYMSVLTFATALIITFIPGIKAEDIERRSQANRERDGRTDHAVVESAAEYVSMYEDLVEIDISGYDKLINIHYYKDDMRYYSDRDNDSLKIFDPYDNLVFVDSYESIAEKLFRSAGIENPDDIPADSLRSRGIEFMTLDAGSLKLVFQSLGWDKDKDGYTLDNISVAYILTREDSPFPFDCMIIPLSE